MLPLFHISTIVTIVSTNVKTLTIRIIYFYPCKNNYAVLITTM